MKNDGWWLLLILGIATVLRIPGLNESLWYDEVIYTSQTFRHYALPNLLFSDAHPPLYPLLMWCWTFAIGDTEILSRLPSLLMGLAAIVISFALVRRIFGRPAAFLTAAFLAVSPVHIWYSQENKINMMLMLMAVSSAYTAYRAWETNEMRRWILFGIVAAMTAWTHSYGAFTVVACLGWVWLMILLGPGWKHIRGACVACIPIAIAMSPLALYAILRHESIGRIYLRAFSAGEIYKLFLIYLSHGNTLHTIWPFLTIKIMFERLSTYFLWDLFFAVAVLAGFAYLLRRTFKRDEDIATRAGGLLILMYTVVPILGAFALTAFVRKCYVDRSMLALVPSFAILMAGAVLMIRPILLRRLATVASFCVYGFAIYTMQVVKVDYTTVNKPNPDWRSTAAFFDSELAENQGQVLLFSTTPLRALQYYDTRLLEVNLDYVPNDTEHVIMARRPDREYTAEDLHHALHMQGLDTFYLVRNCYWTWWYDDLLSVIVEDPHFELIDSESFRSLDIFKYRVRP